MRLALLIVAAVAAQLVACGEEPPSATEDLFQAATSVAVAPTPRPETIAPTRTIPPASITPTGTPTRTLQARPATTTTLPAAIGPTPTLPPTTVASTPTPLPATIAPTPTAATAAPDFRPTPTATGAPKPPPTFVPVSPEDIERQQSFMENFRSISYEASLALPDRFSESDGPLTANASGWITADGTSQMFARIEMTEPVERSIEVVTLNSFDIYLKDLDEGKWYFIPENSDTDTGPLEDIMTLPFMALAFGVAPAGELEPVQDGYVRTIEDPSWGSITATYDQAHVLEGIIRADNNGQEILRASFFDLNQPHDILPYEKGELLPETYWEPR